MLILQTLLSLALFLMLFVPVLFGSVMLLALIAFRCRRFWGLRRQGYFLGHSRDPEARHVYEEVHGKSVRKVSLATDQYDVGSHHLIIPTREEWDATAPEWARGRRDEIYRRALASLPEGWAELPEDWPAETKGAYVGRA
ncbi:MAG: hypothetical protein ACO1QS_04440 [Verrucomicrobiota bacterium]